MGSKLGSLHPAKRKGGILREVVFDREDKEAALTSYAKMELSRAMVWFDSSDVDGRGAAPCHPQAGRGHCPLVSHQLSGALPPALPSALSWVRDNSSAADVISTRFP